MKGDKQSIGLIENAAMPKRATPKTTKRHTGSSTKEPLRDDSLFLALLMELARCILCRCQKSRGWKTPFARPHGKKPTREFVFLEEKVLAKQFSTDPVNRMNPFVAELFAAGQGPRQIDNTLHIARVQHQEASRDVSWRHEWMFVFLGCCFSGGVCSCHPGADVLRGGSGVAGVVDNDEELHCAVVWCRAWAAAGVHHGQTRLSHKRRRRCRCTRPRCTSQVGRRSSQDTQYDTSHNNHPCRLISTHGTRGHERGQAGDVRRPRPRGLGLLYALRRFPRGCCVIARIALRCGLPPMAALLSTSQRTPLDCE